MITSELVAARVRELRAEAVRAGRADRRAFRDAVRRVRRRTPR